MLNFHFVLWGMDINENLGRPTTNCPTDKTSTDKTSKDLLLAYTFDSCSMDKMGKFPFKFPSTEKKAVSTKLR